jgi:hypothetical protein
MNQNTAAEDFKPELLAHLADQSIRPRSGRTGRMARRVRVLIALGILGSTMGIGVIATAGTASAATPAVNYGAGEYSGLTKITNGSTTSCLLTGRLPTSMIDYAGTTEVATVLTQERWNGTSWVFSLRSTHVTETWVPLGNQLDSIYWDDDIPSQTYWSFGTATAPSYWEVLATSMWLIGGRWYSSDTTNFGVYYC